MAMAGCEISAESSRSSTMEVEMDDINGTKFFKQKRSGGSSQNVDDIECQTSYSRSGSSTSERESEDGLNNKDRSALLALCSVKHGNEDFCKKISSISSRSFSSSGSSSSSGPRWKGLHGLRYTVTDSPNALQTILFCLQHLITFMGICTLVTRMMIPRIGGSQKDVANVISSLFISSGLSTLIQNTFGSRLPLIQGPSYPHVLGVLGLLLYYNSLQMTEGSTINLGYEDIMREIQGAFIASALFQTAIGYFGIIGLFTRFLSPVSISPTIISIGIVSFGNALEGVVQCPEVGLVQIFLIILLAQYLKGLAKVNRKFLKLKFSDSYSILIPSIITWIAAVILTESGVFQSYRTSEAAQLFCRTDNREVLSAASWFSVPQIFENGGPIFSWPSILVIFGATLTSTIESIGCYYAVARVAGAPIPEKGAINRGIGCEGLGLLLTACFGSGGIGIVSNSSTIGVIGITKVGSKRVIQYTACLMIFCGMVGKVGALCSTMPLAVVSGMLCCTCGLISSVGISIAQVAKLNSPRNLFIMGFAIFNGFSVQRYFKISMPSQDLGVLGLVQTPSTLFNVVANSLLFNPMVLSLLLAFLLDVTVPSSRQERGLQVWNSRKLNNHKHSNMRYEEVYYWPWGLGKRFFWWAFWL